MTEPHQTERDVTDNDDFLSLRYYTETLFRYRRVIAAALLGTVLIFVAGVGALLVLYPSEKTSSLQFRLLFDGAADHEYPNKTPFSPAEIVAPPVISEVFKANDLEQYGKYEQFKNAIFVRQSNPKIDLLNSEFQSRLADPRLTPVDRARVEAEFSQKLAALTDPTYSVSLRRTERFRTLPDTLAEKVLNDTLATWAAQAERAGAMKYELPVLSSGVLSKGSLETEDYLVSADLLRAKAIRIIKTIDELEKIPGALTIRASKDSVTLPEIRADIEDALRFELEPLLGIIRSEGITKNARLLSMYATTQVFQIRIEKAAAEGRARAVQNSLADYMAQRGMRVGADKPGGGKPGLDTAAVIPQFSESFLDRLVEMSATTQKSEMEYRQKLTDQIIKEGITVTTLDKELAYYEDVAKAVQGIGNRPAGSKELVDLIKSRSQKAFDAIAKAADHLVALYQELSTRNLNPAARLYVVTMPFSRQTVGALSWGSVAYSFVAVLLIVLIVVPAGCLIHNARVRRSAA